MAGPAEHKKTLMLQKLTCVLDFLALALSGSSVSEAPFSRCRLALFIGEGASSLIFCESAAEPLDSQTNGGVDDEVTTSPRSAYLAGLLHGVRLAVGAVCARRAGRGASAGA